MATISTGIGGEANIFNLKEINANEIKEEVYDFLVKDEEVIQCFKTLRDQVIFTSKRVFIINVQGITGKKVSYYSYPYSKVCFFGIETAGLIDIDSELRLSFLNGDILQFDFKARVDIKKICSNISKYVLEK